MASSWYSISPLQWVKTGRLSVFWWKLLSYSSSLQLAGCCTSIMELQPSNVENVIVVARKSPANPPHLSCPLESHWSNQVTNLKLGQFIDSGFNFFPNFSCGEEASLSPTFPFLGYAKMGFFFPLHQLPKEIIYGF